MIRNATLRLLPLAATIGLLCSAQASASTYVYEGRLDDGGRPADGRYDLSLTAYPAEKQGTTLAAPMVFENVEVRGGQFRLEFDLPAMNADHTWLELGVRDGAAEGSFAAIPGRAKAIAAPLVGACWSTTGDSGVNPAINFLGTTDNQALAFRVNNTRAWEASFVSAGINGTSVNVVAGDDDNSATPTFTGQTVAGGGNGALPNRAQENYATVSGGRGNLAARVNATVSGGEGNTASGDHSAVAGGRGNSATGPWSAVGGGGDNCAGGTFSWAGGRFAKIRTGTFSGVPGSGCAGVPAAGDADGDRGTFVWSDSQDGAFQSTGDNQFLVRSGGGMAINTNTPTAGNALTVNGSVSTSGAHNFGMQTRQMLNLWGPTATNSFYGIGVQSSTLYQRTDAGGSFAWFAGGSHNDAGLSPGTGGARTMSLGPEGQLELVNASTTVSPRLRLSFGSAGALANRFWEISAARNQINPGGPVIPAGSLILADDVGIKAAFDINGLSRNPSGSWTSWSDERLKSNIRGIESPLETLLGMHGHWFEYRDPKAVMATPGPRMGLIAQEVRKVLPEWVSEGPDGMLSVTTTGFEALAIEAMRELRDEATSMVAVQANDIMELKAENAALRDETSALREQTQALLERVVALEAHSGGIR